MPKGVNKVTLLGNLGREPEFRTTSNGIPVCTLNVATSDNYKDKSGEWKEATEWHRVVLWNRLAETADKYLKKGSRVYLEGKLKTRSYEDKTGAKRYTTEVEANTMVMLSGVKAEGGSDRVDLPDDEYVGPLDEHLGTDDSLGDDVPF